MRAIVHQEFIKVVQIFKQTALKDPLTKLYGISRCGNVTRGQAGPPNPTEGFLTGFWPGGLASPW